MNKVVLGVIIGAILALNSSFALDRNDGKAIFQSKGCTVCHQDTMETVGPSLEKISMLYSGKEEDLVSYLKGQGSAIVYPNRAGAMQPQLLKIRNLFEDETRALARYISTVHNFREDF